MEPYRYRIYDKTITDPIEASKYVGETTRALNDRFNSHISSGRNYINNIGVPETRQPSKVNICIFFATLNNGVSDYDYFRSRYGIEKIDFDTEEEGIAYYDTFHNGWNSTESGEQKYPGEMTRQRMSRAQCGRQMPDDHPWRERVDNQDGADNHFYRHDIDNEEVVRLADSGLSQCETAAALDTSRGVVVSRYMEARGYLPRHWGKTEASKGKRNGRYRHDVDRRQCAQDRESGMSLAACADKHGISTPTVKSIHEEYYG